MPPTSFLTFLGKTTEENHGKDTIRALPAQWYTSREFYELERRSIFGRKWQLITHRSRFQVPGDFVRYRIAGYDFIIIMDRERQIGAFHNICRHRAYTVVEQEAGKKNILACRYHGWSYGLNGKLAKAPDYQKLSGFEKEQNGLFRIHTHIDKFGFVWINLDAAAQPEISWEAEFAGVDEQERLKAFNLDDYELDHTWEQKLPANWKILADNFNECYHCKTTHPDIPTFLSIDAHDVELKDGHMQHDHAAPAEFKKDCVNSTYYFPGTSTSISPHFMMIQKFLPEGPVDSTMHYEVYKNKHSSDEDFRFIADMYRKVMGEDKVLCEGQMGNLKTGVFTSGELHPQWERGPLFFQHTIRKIVTEHFRREKELGREIFPAKRGLPKNEKVDEEDLEMCGGGSCPAEQEALAW
ncbi:hypothetical protein D0867_04684 [Hortaea werneckii]|uniref:Choline monooxygenase, chloroplastic n=1 Tax=Hortaea werneckii TaxID=91943 RepID=A0A3M7B4V2_HORWE|nr:hypothetical protein D0867_04684 [Hortaea werneckii]RMY34678.1 hypothetical protein D0866_05100 [Hortaea werneckii]